MKKEVMLFESLLASDNFIYFVLLIIKPTRKIRQKEREKEKRKKVIINELFNFA